MKAKIFDNDKIKMFRSDEINYNFNKENGYTETWGKTKEHDPDFCKYGNMILDIEVTDICKGIGGVPCPFCYKSNNPKNTSNMSLQTFKDVMSKMPKLLQQIAFGVDAQCESNPDIWEMMEYTRSIGIIPNVTIADISDEIADNLVKYCGAVACSCMGGKQKITRYLRRKKK